MARTSRLQEPLPFLRFYIILLALTLCNVAFVVVASPASPSATGTKVKAWLSLPVCARNCVVEAGKTVNNCHVVLSPACVCGATQAVTAAAKACVKNKCAASAADLKASQEWYQDVCQDGGSSSPSASVTVTVTLSPSSAAKTGSKSKPASAAASSRPSSSSSSSPSKGAIAGIVIGVLALVLAIAGAAFVIRRRRRKGAEKEKLESRKSSISHQNSGNGVEVEDAGTGERGSTYPFNGEDYNGGRGGAIHEMSNDTILPAELPGESNSGASPSPSTSPSRSPVSPNEEGGRPGGGQEIGPSLDIERSRTRARELDRLEKRATATELP